MFVVEIGMLLSFVLTFIPNLFIQEHVSRIYVLSIFIILLLTLIFANFSEALAEGRESTSECLAPNTNRNDCSFD